jgi:hypothetical protein
MFFLKKCAYKNCKRSGSVALVENDKFCNLHTQEKPEVEDEENGTQVKGEEHREPRQTDPENPEEI